jgi:hypothetical protein
MNERIRELALQADGVVINKMMTGARQYTFLEDDLEKFAELIVQECVQQLELVRKYRYDRVQPLENQQTIIDECQYQIKQHFGVEP